MGESVAAGRWRIYENIFYLSYVSCLFGLEIGIHELKNLKSYNTECTYISKYGGMIVWKHVMEKGKRTEFCN